MKQSDLSSKKVPQAGMEGDRLKTQQTAGSKRQDQAVPGEPNKPRGKQAGMKPSGGKGAKPSGGKRLK